MSKENDKVLEICKEKGLECKHEKYTIHIGDATHTFCCIQGFEETIKDLKKILNEVTDENDNQ